MPQRRRLAPFPTTQPYRTSSLTFHLVRERFSPTMDAARRHSFQKLSPGNSAYRTSTLAGPGVSQRGRIFFRGRCFVLTGAHVVVYSQDAEADRAFFRDILGFRWVDAGRGCLIFAVPAAEVAFHPHDQNNKHEMFFTCDDLKVQVAALQKKGVQVGKISEERWGARTTISLPGGGAIGLYEPKHPVTFERIS